jgi:hypothetical protein
MSFLEVCVTTVSQLHSWTLHEPPVLTGPVADGLFTLERLGSPDRARLLGSTVEGRHPRLESLLALHWAVLAAVDVVVAPFAFDALEISATPRAIGVVVDDRIGVLAFWVGDVEAAPGDTDARRLGRTVRSLLDPVVRSTLGPDRLDADEAERLLGDALTAAVRRLEGATLGLAADGWADALLQGAAEVARGRRAPTSAGAQSAA